MTATIFAFVLGSINLEATAPHTKAAPRFVCTEQNESLPESANGSMATAATRIGENLVEQKHKRIHLTPTGLLMEGDYTHNPTALFRKRRFAASAGTVGVFVR